MNKLYSPVQELKIYLKNSWKPIYYEKNCGVDKHRITRAGSDVIPVIGPVSKTITTGQVIVDNLALEAWAFPQVDKEPLAAHTLQQGGKNNGYRVISSFNLLRFSDSHWQIFGRYMH